jgi:pyruvate/2-oxoglutarate dehydrogenase complex dihydrolipoamide dehydrogenase (E3) component
MTEKQFYISCSLVAFVEGETYPLLHEDGELALIFNVDELLAAIGRVGNVQLVEENIMLAMTRISTTKDVV